MILIIIIIIIIIINTIIITIIIITIIIIIMGISGRAMNKRVSPAAFLIVFSTGQRTANKADAFIFSPTQAGRNKNLLEIVFPLDGQ